MVDVSRNMKLIDKIIVHCSDTDHPDHDNVEAIRQMHMRRGWSDIGYHFFINKHGHIADGRPITKSGSHCVGQNLRSIGICVSGRKEFYDTQFRQLNFLIRSLMKWYNIPKEKIFPHNFFNKNKSCPNFSIEKIWLFDENKTKTTCYT